MYKVVYLPTARQQLTDAVLYIARELSNPAAAESLLEEVEKQVGFLKEMPYRFSVYPALLSMKREIRMVPVKEFILFYTIREEEKTVEIWRFLHQRQKR